MTFDFFKVIGLDRIIHEPSRLLILSVLYPVPSMDFLKLRKSLRYTKGNLSSHLAKLERAGYVAMEKKFHGKHPVTLCRLTNRGREALARYADNLQGVSNATRDLLQTKT